MIMQVFFQMESVVHSTIGERLQQARKRLGISIDEAADKLKFRRDLLKRFESNEFDCGMPRVYVRGFLKSYAKYLKLNSSGILHDFDEIYGATTKVNKFSLGQLKFADEESSEEEQSQRKQTEPIENSAKYVKPVPQFVYFRLLIVAVALCIGIFITFGVFKWIKRARNNAIESVAVSETVITCNKFCIVATDNVQVLVRNEYDKQRIFSGTLSKGEKKEIESQNNVQLSYSDGANLYIEKADGTHLKPPKSGRGWLRI